MRREPDAPNVHPNTDIEEPTRTKLRTDSVLPKCTKFNTAIELPNRDKPKAEIVLPMRKKFFKDKLLPSCKKSKTEADDPN